MAKTKPNWDRITSISAMFIAVTAIVVSAWQGVENRKHNRLSVRPKLQIVFKAEPEGDAAFFVRNDGLGPAVINKFDVLLDDTLVDKVSISAIFKLVKTMQLEAFPFTFDPIVNSTTIREGDQVDILRFTKHPDFDMRPVIDTLSKYNGRIHFMMEYESMYGEEFSQQY